MFYVFLDNSYVYVYSCFMYIGTYIHWRQYNVNQFNISNFVGRPIYTIAQQNIAPFSMTVNEE